MKNKKMTINITSPEKIIYQVPKTTKLEVVYYYNKVSNLMLPYVKNRPLSVIRCHAGIDSECFFKKHPNSESVHIKTFFDGDEEYFYLSNTTGIVNQAQMGTLEFHPWGSRITKIEKPDIMIFDLDPGDNVSISKLREGVSDLKGILDDLQLTAFLKTSGGKGYHVVIPFTNTKNWTAFSSFSKQIATIMQVKWPKKYTISIRKKERNGKIFIDYLRNDRGSTCVAPYSLRARTGAPISMPIFWDELYKIKPSDINIKNVDERLNLCNPWNNFFNVKQSIK